MLFPEFREERSRYERKFLVTDMFYHDIEQQVRVHPAAFSPIFHSRYINNIYFDTYDLDFYHDNVTGKGSRKKARIRWYDDQQQFVEKPVLEFKVREGMLGDKLSYRLKPFHFDQEITNETLQDVFRRSEIPDWAREMLLQLKPALLNRYRRQYFASFDNRFRITLDDDLSYHIIGSRNNTFIEHHTSDDVIVELKYERIYDDIAPQVTNKLPFRLTKSSKYVNGIDFLHPMITG